MRIFTRVAAVAFGMALLLSGWMSPTAFTQGNCNLKTSIEGPSTGAVDQNLVYHSNTTLGSGCGAGLRYTVAWSLSSKPEGAPSWSESGSDLFAPRDVIFAPKVAGEYVIHLEVEYGTAKASADQKLTVTGQSSQSPPPSQQPPSQQASACSSEFNSSTLEPFLTSYIPKAGPTFSLTVNPGFLTMQLPGTTTFDHWSGVDQAPQLRLVAPSGDWEITTSMRVLQPAGLHYYHAGLMVVFSRFELFYWGIYRGKELWIEISGYNNAYNVKLDSAAMEIELLIAKSGNKYSFSYRSVGSTRWTQLGQLTKQEAPQFVGLFGKTWVPTPLTVDFDYLRVNNGC